MVILCLVSAPTDAQPESPVPPAWIIVPEDSTIAFTGKQMGASFEGEFERFEGTILFDPDQPEDSRANITVDIGSVVTHSADRDQYILAPAWLAGESFPKARFVTEAIVKTATGYEATGTLTIKDISQPVRLPFSLDFMTDDQGDETAMMTGSFPVKRLDYNIGEGQWSDTDMVGNELTVHVTIKAVKEIQTDRGKSE